MVSVDLGSSPNWGKSLIAVENVEELAKTQLTQVPERYVKSDEERPAIFESATDLFDSEKNSIVIDMSKIAQEQYREEEIRKMAKACEEWGFFQVL
ncbi:hypothetical protein SUGI_0538510 [Cryptomeria japonica]|nr:hypothetical protein SUGI_0538510 [Cryptomeria japonica]